MNLFKMISLLAIANLILKPTSPAIFQIHVLDAEYEQIMEEKENCKNDEIYGHLGFGTEQDSAKGNLGKKVQDRVENIYIGPTRDKTAENEQKWLVNML